MDILAQRIKALRTEKELTMDMMVRDLKSKFPDIKIEKSMLSRWEKGENAPTWENCKYLSIYFDVSLDYLAGLTDTRTPSRLLAYSKKLKKGENNE